MPLTQTIGTLFLLAPTATTLKGSFGVYGLKNSFQLTQELLCGEVQRESTNNKVRTQGRTHSEKKTQKCQHLCYFNQLLPLYPKGSLENISGFKSAYVSCPYKPYRVTLLTRWWSAYVLKQQRQVPRLPKLRGKKGGSCAFFKMNWLWNCLFSWSSNFFLPHCCRFYCLTLEMKNRILRCKDCAILRRQGVCKYSSQTGCALKAWPSLYPKNLSLRSVWSSLQAWWPLTIPLGQCERVRSSVLRR